MLKSNFVLVSMREDFFYNKSELRSAVDQKLIEWIFSLNLNSLLVPNIKTLSIYLKSKEIKINVGSKINLP